jgi:Pyruvate/2-oxoacid:ferredoxin oxidoreductase gamma subunit
MSGSPTEKIIISGFGGQGTLLAGKLLCVAAMRQGRSVTHIPSYGAEMRGGTANCSVVISDEDIASPVIEHPSVVIALNGPVRDEIRIPSPTRRSADLELVAGEKPAHP